MSTTPAGRAALVALAAVLMQALPGAAASAADQSSVNAETSAYELVRAALVEQPGPAAANSGGTTLAVGVAAKLPACRYRDKLTRFDKVKHWRKTLLDTNLKVKRAYVPWDLVSVSRANIKGSGRVRKVIISDLKAMAKAARKAGKPLRGALRIPLLCHAGGHLQLVGASHRLPAGR